MKSLRILYIAPHSFPVRSSESIVNSKLAYSLAESGHIVDVFSVEFAQIYPTCLNIDDFFNKSENLRIHVVKIKDYDLRKPKSFFDFICSYLFYFWMLINIGYFYNKYEVDFRLYRAVKRFLRKDCKYDFVITRGFSTELTARFVCEKYKIPWIANWNDPYPDQKFPPPYGQGPNAKLSKRQSGFCGFMQKNVYFHTFPSERLKNYMLSYFTDIRYENAFVIPHMAHSEFMPTCKKNDHSTLKFVHCGNVKFPRNPSNFIIALSHVLNDNPQYREMIKCDFYGMVDESCNQLVVDLNIEDVVKINKGIDYFETLSKIEESDVSLIIEAICEEGIYLPTKVVDSIQCKTPIFAISPAVGTLNDLITNNKIGYFASNDKIDNITATLKKIICDKISNNLPIITKDSLPEIFENSIIRKYNEIFQSIDNE